MNIIKLIENKKAIRKYKSRKIPKNVIGKILSGGIWGPSVYGSQPWKFFVIQDKNLIMKIGGTVSKGSNKLPSAIGLLLRFTIKTITNSQMLMLVYNVGILRSKARKYKKFSKLINITEIEAISASIENMLLVAESLGISSCWLTLPLLKERLINKILNTKGKLLAILTFGYPAEKGRRSPRKRYEEVVRFIE